MPSITITVTKVLDPEFWGDLNLLQLSDQEIIELVREDEQTLLEDAKWEVTRVV